MQDQQSILKPPPSNLEPSLNRRSQKSGGRFDFEDGGTYCGGWEDGKAHGHGVCTGPKHQGAYAGAWNYGFEVSGIYNWPSGSHYEGQWQNGRRHGLGVERRGRHVYRGEWSNEGQKGRYGVRQSTTSTAKYEGTWNKGFQDGYGVETLPMEWLEGKRHGHGIRTSAPFGLASHYKTKNMATSMSSLRSNEDTGDKRSTRIEESRGGFVLTGHSGDTLTRRNSFDDKSKKGFLSGLKKKQKSAGDLDKRGTMTSGSIRSTTSAVSWLSTGSSHSNMTARSVHTESNASFSLEEDLLDPSITETYSGEWKKDKREGFGIAERSDGLKYIGEWSNNRKHGYGITIFQDGRIEEGKYKNNILITKAFILFTIKKRKFCTTSFEKALQRADIAISRQGTAQTRAEEADHQAEIARIDCEHAIMAAREFSPDFKPAVLERFEKLRYRNTYLPKYEMNNTIQSSQNQLYYKQQQQQQRDKIESHPIPDTMYSQKPAVSPQTDLSQFVSNQQALNKKQQAMMSSLSSSSMHQQPPQSPSTVSTSINAFQNQNNELINNKPDKVLNVYPDRKENVLNLQTSTSHNENIINNNNIYMDPQIHIKDVPNATDEKSLHQFRKSSLHNVKPPTLKNINNNQQSSIDFYDHYKRPPSRDSSIDRYTRAASRLSGGSRLTSRQPSIDKTNIVTEPITSSTPVRKSSAEAPATNNITKNAIGSMNGKYHAPFEDIILRQRTLGQDIIPSPLQPKRTESLFVPPKPAGQNVTVSKVLKNMEWFPQDDEEEEISFSPALLARRASESWIDTSLSVESANIAVNLNRKKSLPDFQGLPLPSDTMSREEVSALGSARREEVRRLDFKAKTGISGTIRQHFR
uniref:Junctophilin n=1 Tax=Megaselia scalaris TaxID=36166 RepID=T1GPG0_MEGSC